MDSQFYILAQIRDEYDNRMPIVASVEFFVRDKRLAWFRGTTHDYELLDQYGTYGSSFLVFSGQQQLRVLKHRFSYDAHRELDGLDRFDMGMFTFTELLRLLYYNRDEWRINVIEWIVEKEQQKNGPAYPLSPIQLVRIADQF